MGESQHHAWQSRRLERADDLKPALGLGPRGVARTK
jgi:hypothetical protein